MRSVIVRKLHWLVMAVLLSLGIVALVEYLKAPWYFAAGAIYMENRDPIMVNEMLISRDMLVSKLRHQPDWLARYEPLGKSPAQAPFKLHFLTPKFRRGTYEVTFQDSLHCTLHIPGRASSLAGAVGFPLKASDTAFAVVRVDSLPAPQPGDAYRISLLNDDEVYEEVQGQWGVTQLVTTPNKLTLHVRHRDSTFAIQYLDGLIKELLYQEVEYATTATDDAIAEVNAQIALLSPGVDTSNVLKPEELGANLRVFSRLNDLGSAQSNIQDLRLSLRQTLKAPSQIALVWTPERVARLHGQDSAYADILVGYLESQGQPSSTPRLLQVKANGQATLALLERKWGEMEGLRRHLEQALLSEMKGIHPQNMQKLGTANKGVQFSAYLQLVELHQQRNTLLKERANITAGIRLLETPYVECEGRMAYPSKMFFWVPFGVFWLVLVVLTRRELIRILPPEDKLVKQLLKELDPQPEPEPPAA